MLARRRRWPRCPGTHSLLVGSVVETVFVPLGRATTTADPFSASRPIQDTSVSTSEALKLVSSSGLLSLIEISTTSASAFQYMGGADKSLAYCNMFGSTFTLISCSDDPFSPTHTYRNWHINSMDRGVSGLTGPYG